MAQERIEGNVPLTIDFTNSSVGDNLSYSWDFGDGTTSTDGSPQHVYNQTGTFNVTLTVTNIYGSNSKTSSVVVTRDTGQEDDRDTGQDRNGGRNGGRNDERNGGNGERNGGRNDERNGGRNDERNGGNGRR